MNLDWIVAIGVFLLFVVWAFASYNQLFVIQQESPGEALEIISEKVLENLTVPVHTIPLKVNHSNVSIRDAVMWFEYRWPFGLNTTKIYKGISSKSCNITGNKVYWKSDLDAEANYFRMKYSAQAANLSCTGGFSVVNEIQVVLFAVEEREDISRARMNHMNNTNYSVFRDRLGIARDFNVTIQNGSTVLVSYGLPPPGFGDVFSKSFLRRLEETDENITIRFLTW